MLVGAWLAMQLLWHGRPVARWDHGTVWGHGLPRPWNCLGGVDVVAMQPAAAWLCMAMLLGRNTPPGGIVDLEATTHEVGACIAAHLV